MRPLFLATLVAALGLSCSCPPPPPAAAPAPRPAQPAPAPAPPTPTGRTAAIPADHPQHARVEGTDFQNACRSDADCHVGGCSQEVCSAEEGVSSTCEAPADGWPTQGAGCGCLAGVCAWYRDDGAVHAKPASPAATPEPPAPTPPPATGSTTEISLLPGQRAPCDAAGRCGAGLTCLRYYGVAGPRGPTFSSCEVPCKERGGCPAHQKCATIADGPGRVCVLDK